MFSKPTAQQIFIKFGYSYQSSQLQISEVEVERGEINLLFPQLTTTFAKSAQSIPAGFPWHISSPNSVHSLQTNSFILLRVLSLLRYTDSRPITSHLRLTKKLATQVVADKMQTSDIVGLVFLVSLHTGHSNTFIRQFILSLF